MTFLQLIFEVDTLEHKLAALNSREREKIFMHCGTILIFCAN